MNPLSNSNTLRAGVATLALAVASLLAACSPSAGAQTPQQGPPPAPTVGVAAVATRPLVEHAELTGRLAPVESVEVRPRISGYVQEVRFQSGEIVEKDQVLFRIDPRWNQAEVDRHVAEIAAAEARLELAEREADRASKLVERKAISAEESEARVSRVTEARAALAAAKAERATAALDLEYTEVKAPIKGRVSRAIVTAGNYVSGSSGSNTVLTTIVSVDPVYFYADLDEAAFLRFERAMHARAPDAPPIQVELGLADEKGYPRRGKLESLDNRLDPASGTILLRATFSNEDGRLVPGLFARARVPIGEEHPALFVDERAVGTDQNQKFVLAVGAGDVAEYRKVELGPVIDGQRVIRSGVEAGDRVIVTGLQRVRPGMPVKPGPIEETTSTADARR